ncbi:PadR family transcriptional regulator [Xylanimonas ulmi]|uniref:PadR family transcriptional regulator n=1 Tax=Xylanimonas ulmi TaxID=228973 RepID=A0A4Q7LZZ0_9MICO|nr:PadR family transcriptional regulator [Xylanibacterium ulmi]RZS60017.1 PadR family transcriptional regulator [Xylanibacterium ulmi]
MDERLWPADLMRGALDLCVLRIVGDGPTYGYAIAAALSERGLGTVKGGTLYPLLKRFEGAGWVTVDWRPGDGGPGRKFYVLTAAGRAVLNERADIWNAFAAVVTSFANAQNTSEEALS